jgi:hypothetical protein
MRSDNVRPGFTPHFRKRPRHCPDQEWRTTSPRSSASHASRLVADYNQHVVEEQDVDPHQSSEPFNSIHHDIMPGWEVATAIKKVSSNTYTGTLYDDWCIGSGKLPRAEYSFSDQSFWVALESYVEFSNYLDGLNNLSCASQWSPDLQTYPGVFKLQRTR